MAAVAPFPATFPFHFPFPFPFPFHLSKMRLMFDTAKMLRDLRNGFIAGVAALTPLVITFFVVNILLTHVGDPAGNLLFQDKFEDWRRPDSATRVVFNIIATILVFILITGVGFFSRYIFGKFILGTGERIINAVPFVNTVYKTVKQIVDTFREQENAIFQKVVLIEYPKRGTFAIGFLTSDAKGEIQSKTGADVVNIFVPTTPNPTSGFLLMVARAEVIDLDMTITEGMKLIISGGAVSPPWPRVDAVPKLPKDSEPPTPMPAEPTSAPPQQ